MKISKFAKFMLAGALVLGIFGLKEAATPQKAEAAYDYFDCVYSDCQVNDMPNGMRFSTDVTNYYKGLSTYVQSDIVIFNDYKTYYWNMIIYKNYSGVWKKYLPAATKSGYVSQASSSSRTWSMIDFTAGSYKVWMKITGDNYGNSYSDWEYTTPFTVHP